MPSTMMPPHSTSAFSVTTIPAGIVTSSSIPGSEPPQVAGFDQFPDAAATKSAPMATGIWAVKTATRRIRCTGLKGFWFNEEGEGSCSGA